jgi:hypothetical protein
MLGGAHNAPWRDLRGLSVALSNVRWRQASGRGQRANLAQGPFSTCR